MGSLKNSNTRKMTISGPWATALRVISSVRLLALLSSLMVLTILRSVGWSQNLPKVGQKPAPTVGAPAIGFELKTLEGKSIGLDALRGKPLIMNFFASWCDPCREEMPLVNTLASKGNKDGYTVLGIAVEDTRAAVTEYAKEAGLVFPIALDLNSTVKRAYRIFGPPATFFIDAQGVIRDMVVGPITPERAQEGLKKAGVTL